MKLHRKSPLIFALLLGVWIIGCAPQGYTHSPQTTEERRNRLQVAEAMFQERCKAAGEKIYQIVENVEGVFLMKIRPEKDNFSDQFALDDPYGRDFGGKAAIRTLLRGEYSANNHGGTRIAGAPLPPLGFHYVEAIDPQDGKRYRYTGSIKAIRRKDPSAPNVQIELKRDSNYDLNIYSFVLDSAPASEWAPRYGITYDDISTREEREYWIAGSSLKVIDLQTNEVIAERIGYMMDRGQGNTSGGRSPWLYAADYACPSFQRNPLRQPGHGAETQVRQTQYFVEKVLKPKLNK